MMVFPCRNFMQGLFQQVQQEVSAIKRAQQEAARGATQK